MKNTKKISEGKRKPGAQPGNSNAITHGIYANRLLAKEQEIFSQLIGAFLEGFRIRDSAGQIQAELLAVHTVKMFRALCVKNFPAVERLDRIIRANYKAIKKPKRPRRKDQFLYMKADSVEWVNELIKVVSTPGD